MNKEIDTSNDLILSKLEIASHQLDQALKLFLDNNDYVSSVTLAGASEEILGKILEKQGQLHSLNDLTSTCVKIGKHVYGEQWHEKEFVSIANYFRNGFKHYDDGNPIAINRECASEIIERAISNYFSLTGDETELMKKFNMVMFGV